MVLLKQSLLRPSQDLRPDLPEELRLAYLPSYGIIKLRLTATGHDREQLEKSLGIQ